MSGAPVRAAADVNGDTATPAASDTMEVLSRCLADALHAAPRLPVRARVEYGQASIEVEWPEPAGAGPVDPALQASPDEAAQNEELLAVVAPLVGTFYRSPEPSARPFVEVGDEVIAGQQVGIVEAMKLMNPVVAEAPGRVVRVAVSDSEPVEYGQPLILLEPRPEG